jgi:predicted RNase H-like HicB family nuclease
MQTYTIVVQPAAEDEGHIAVVPDLPGWTATGRTVEECVARAREVIGLVTEGLAAEPSRAGTAGRGGAVADQAEEEALDALRRGMAALPPLRRPHGALLRARRSLGEEEQRALDRLPDPATV